MNDLDKVLADPLPFKGIGSGFESLGWMLMFIAGIKYINSKQKN